MYMCVGGPAEADAGAHGWNPSDDFTSLEAVLKHSCCSMVRPHKARPVLPVKKATTDWRFDLRTNSGPSIISIAMLNSFACVNSSLLARRLAPSVAALTLAYTEVQAC